MSEPIPNGLELNWLERQPGGVNKEMTQRSQFDSEEVGLSEALVREAGQNTLDAGIQGRDGPIRVRIAVVRPEPDDSKYLSNILAPLLPHLRSCQILTDDLDFAHPTLLVIEDFGTTGLTGAWDDEEAVGGWYDFFRNFGASHKTGGRGGRWGLGKLVFTSASKARAFFALTVRAEDDPRCALLMGQAVLKAHKIGDARYDSHGFFDRPNVRGDLQLPVDDSKEVARFAQACGLIRGREPGLSIVIPFPDIEHQASTIGQELAKHLLSNFFFPILSGNLVADVDGAEISEATFDSVVKNFGGEVLYAGNLAVFIREMREAAGRGPDVVLRPGWYGAIGSAMPDGVLEELRSRFADGQLVRVRFPIQVRPRDGDVRSTFVDVSLRKTRGGERPASICARGMLTVPGEAKGFFVLPRCLEWVETSAPCLAGPRHPPDGVSLFG